MKRLTAYTRAELAELTEDEIQKLIDLECASEGIALLPPKPEKTPELELPEPDLKAYVVAGIIVSDMKHASRLLETITSGTIFKSDYSGDYNRKYLKPLKQADYNYPKIEQESYYSPELYDELKRREKAHKEQYGAWKQLEKQYDEALEARQSIASEVFKAINEARDYYFEIERIRSQFERYLVLAENNRQIAMNFLEKVANLEPYEGLRDELLQLKEEVANDSTN